MTGRPTGIQCECPICGKSMTALSETNKPKNVGINQLRTHIRSTTGEGHGPSGTIPAHVTEELLADHVELSEVAIVAP